MELRTLRYFTVVAQEKNITRAAELLNMSQPPLSNQMHNLEAELGVQLFIRGKRRLTLTAEGELLLRRARQLLDLEEKTRQELSAMRDGMSGTVELGLVEGTEVACLMRSPWSDPTAYRIRGAVIALRRADSAGVLVAPGKEAAPWD